MAKNILRRQFGNMYGNNKPYHTPEPLPNQGPKGPMNGLPPIEPPLFSVTGIILFTLALLLIATIYLNRERAYALANNIYSQFTPLKGLDMIEQKYNDLISVDVSQVTVEKPKEIPDNIETKEKKKEDEKKKEMDGGVKKLEEKINRYSNEQTVKSNGFCYIGYDKERVCTNVLDGDICMSGQVYPTMDVCLNPHLRP